MLDRVWQVVDDSSRTNHFVDRCFGHDDHEHIYTQHHTFRSSDSSDETSSYRYFLLGYKHCVERYYDLSVIFWSLLDLLLNFSLSSALIVLRIFAVDRKMVFQPISGLSISRRERRFSTLQRTMR